MVLAFALVGLVWVACAGRNLTACGPGTHAVANRCVPDEACGPGTELDGGTCLPCAEGTYLEGGRCVPIPSCGSGTTAQGGVCTPCPDRTYFDGGVCLPLASCGPGTVASAGACVPDIICSWGVLPDGGPCPLGGTAVWIESPSVLANGYARLELLAFESLPDGGPFQEQVFLRLTEPARGTITPSPVTLGPLGATAWFIPCNSALDAQCAGPTRIEMVRPSAPGAVLATSAVVEVAPPAPVGSPAMCLDGGPALYLDGEPRDPIHPGAELVTPNWMVTEWDFPGGPRLIQLLDSPWGAKVVLSSRLLGTPLQEQVYDNALAAYFETPGHPGLAVSTRYVCGQVSGRFEIQDLQFDGGSLWSLTATFEQRCDGAPELLRGCLHFGH